MSVRVGWAIAAVTSVAMAVALGGCKRPPKPEPTPDGAYRAFVKRVHDAREGRALASSVLESFDEATRAQLTAGAKDAATRTSDLMPTDPGYQLLVTLPQAPAPQEVTVISQNEREAVLGVTPGVDGGAPAERVTMVREEEAWRIHLDLSAAAAAAPKPAPAPAPAPTPTPTQPVADAGP